MPTCGPRLTICAESRESEATDDTNRSDQAMKTIILAMGMAGLTVFGSTANAAPTVYIPLGSGNQVIAVDAATDRILATYPAVDNPHGLVAPPDGEYLIAGSLVETPLPVGAAHDPPNSKLFLIHPQHGHVMRPGPGAARG